MSVKEKAPQKPSGTLVAFIVHNTSVEVSCSYVLYNGCIAAICKFLMIHIMNLDNIFNLPNLQNAFIHLSKIQTFLQPKFVS